MIKGSKEAFKKVSKNRIKLFEEKQQQETEDNRKRMEYKKKLNKPS